MQNLATQLVLIFERFRRSITDNESKMAYASFLKILKKKILESLSNNDDYHLFDKNFNPEYLDNIDNTGFYMKKIAEMEGELSVNATIIILDYCNIILENDFLRICDVSDDKNLLQIYIGNLLIKIYLLFSVWNKNSYIYQKRIFKINKLTMEKYNFKFDDSNDKTFMDYYEKFLNSEIKYNDEIIFYLRKLYFEHKIASKYDRELNDYLDNLGYIGYKKLKPENLSGELCRFLDINENIKMLRTDVTRKIVNYIEEHDLHNPNNKNEIILDNKLQLLLKVPGGETLTYFNLNSYLWNHYLK